MTDTVDFAKDDVVTVAGCTISPENNGDFRVRQLVGTTVTLEAISGSSITTGDQHNGCTISKQETVDITGPNGAWLAHAFQNTTEYAS